MPVLDGSMVQVDFGRRCTVCLRVLHSDPPDILLGGFLADKLSGVRMLTVLLLGIGSIYLLASLLPAIGVMASLLLLIMICLGMGNGAVFQLVPQRFGRDVGLMTGLVGMTGGIGGFYLAASLGWAKQATGSYQAGLLAFAGLALMFNPASFDWSDNRALLGNGLLLLAAACWAVSIVYVRAHKWISTPFQLVFWEALLATGLLALLALFFDGVPHVEWTLPLVLLLLYSGVCASALGYWAMAMVNRSLPAATTSLGLLGTPVVGTFSAAIALGEPITPVLFSAMVLIVGGIALGTITRPRH